jgi:hypothetical protein
MGDSIVEIEHRPGGEIVVRFKAPSISTIMSEEALDHFRKSQKELVLALRSFLDNAVEYKKQAEKPRARKRSKIEIQ